MYLTKHRLFHTFEPLQILCKADGKVLLARFLARMNSEERHPGHQRQDLAWIEQNKERLLQGYLAPLALGSQLIEIDTATPHHFDYADLLQRVHTMLAPADRIASQQASL